MGKRCRALVEQLWKGLGQAIPLACQDWSQTKAAYRFLSNERVSEQEVLSGHFEASSQRFKSTEGIILVLQDTTTFSFRREHPERIGYIGKSFSLKNEPIMQCGILMHSSLAVTTEGVPLGLTAIKFWTRDKFKGCTALKRKINPTRVPIEEKESSRWLENLRQSTALLGDPGRCVHVGDRESDIYELFCLAQELNTHFLIRTCVNRLAGDGGHTVKDEMEHEKIAGLHTIKLCDIKGSYSEACLEVKFRRLRVLPPLGKQKCYPTQEVTVIHAYEPTPSSERERIEWKLITSLPVETLEDAIEKLEWYAMRWKIETFHKILKSGCRTENSKLQTAERLTKLIAVYCILSWRIFWITMLARAFPSAPVELALTQQEETLLNQLVNDSPSAERLPPLQQVLLKLAKLGGYLARSGDPPPGNTVIWRGIRRLTDIQLGYELARERCG